MKLLVAFLCLLLVGCAKDLSSHSGFVDAKPFIKAYESQSILVAFKSFEVTRDGNITFSNRTALAKSSRLNEEQLAELSTRLRTFHEKYYSSGILTNGWVGVTIYDAGYRAIAFSVGKEMFELRSTHPRMTPDYWPSPPVSPNYAIFRSAWEDLEGICKSLPLYRDFMDFDRPE